ncbi:Os07g0407800 [Oryza sativa Japonica Group]|uniref:Os07g0407800 protein n=1 Tax=Oryza sativa subsp. japonica TaxID=39947 RepID=A0A0P0X5C1_ORYSJ|nr:Os07g0407800 [Oryza sativa Japonica Group]
MERQLACKSCPGPSSPNFFTNLKKKSPIRKVLNEPHNLGNNPDIIDLGQRSLWEGIDQWRDEEGSAAPGHRRTGAAAMGEVALDLDAPGLIAGSLVAPLLRRAKGRGSMSRMLWREG